MKRPRTGGSKGGPSPSARDLPWETWKNCAPPYPRAGAAGRRGDGLEQFERARRLLAEALEADDPAEQLRLGGEAVALCPDFVDAYVALREYVLASHPSASPGGAIGPGPGGPEAALEPLAAPDEPMDIIRPDWGGDLGPVSPLHFGHNTVWVRNGLGIWDASAKPPRPNPAVLALVKGLRPGVLRFPGGTRAMRYHFAEAVGPTGGRKKQCDTFTGEEKAATYGLDEFLKVAAQVRAQVTLVTPWNDAPPEEAAALVAYVNAKPTSTVAIGNWGTAGDWARRRAANGHSDPYGVKFLEIGNEQYLLTPTPPPKGCGRSFPFCQCEHGRDGGCPQPRAHADLVRRTGEMVKRVDPDIRIGASAYSRYDGSDAATAVSVMDNRLGTGDAWNATLVSLAGRAFDYFVLHPYNLPRAATGEPTAPIYPVHPLALAEGLRQTVRNLSALDSSKDVAITEYGDLLFGGRFLGVLLAALITRVALEEQLLMSLRHILIEDNTTEPFADAAAILTPGPRKTMAYEAVRLLAENLTGRVIRAETHHHRLAAFATSEGARGPITIGLVRHQPGFVRLVHVALPPGRWGGTACTLSARFGLLSGDGQIDQTETAVGPTARTLKLPVPANALVIVRLKRG